VNAHEFSVAPSWVPGSRPTKSAAGPADSSEASRNSFHPATPVCQTAHSTFFTTESRDTAASLNTNGTLATDPTYATLDYALTDRNFSVIGTGFTSSEVGDRVRYDPYGTFQAFPAGDVNNDGTVNSTDFDAFIIVFSYQADLDLTMDGSINKADQAVVTKNLGRTLGSSKLSDRGNIVGWCGELYEESRFTGGGMWPALIYAPTRSRSPRKSGRPSRAILSSPTH